tara:strand:- start:3074 stop:3346 length:273 start_codon:yes stop_codon:yes gene_type:complete
MARRVGNIIYNKNGMNIPLYPVWGDTIEVKHDVVRKGSLILAHGKYLINGMAKGSKFRYWQLVIKHDINSKPFFVKKDDINQMFDKGILT